MKTAFPRSGMHKGAFSLRLSLKNVIPSLSNIMTCLTEKKQ